MNRKTLISLSALAICLSGMAQDVKPCIPVDPEIETKVESTLSKMTLDEKIGQMCELTIDTETDYDASGKAGKFIVYNSKLK